MKKLLMTAIIAILLAGLLLVGCTDGNNNNPGDTDPIQGNLLILQAYGNSGEGSPAGVSHSFVELYNISDEAINLDGISLYYADGIRGNDVTADESWKSIVLTGTIPAGGSFLILGAKHGDLSGTRYKIDDGYGDINDNTLSLNRRGFKIAIIKSTAQLTVQNPFNADGNGTKVSGYIDMVGAVNNPDAATPDHIFGYETAPARCSASEAVRRKDLTDYDDNSTDFTAARYALSGAGALTDEEVKARKPRNASAGSWGPFAEPPAPPAPEEPGTPDVLAGKLLILQAYGTGDATDGSVSHTFVELYNTTNAAITLTGYSLQYADGTKVSTGADIDEDWTILELTGSIPAGGSYLVLGKKMNISGRLQITNNSGDKNDADFVLSNRAFKVVLLHRITKINGQNPFDIDGNGGKVAAYIDMVGASNDNTDQILGYEAAAARISKQVAVRRTSLTDSDNNSTDFVSLDYRSAGSTNATVEARKPRNAAAGNWDPFAAIVEPPLTDGTEALMILQANTYGNDNGGGGGFAKSLVELYNNTNAAINLTSDNYYLHIGSNNAWTYQIKLTGTIPAKCSFLIVSNTDTVNATPRAALPTADQEAAFAIANTNFKVAVLKNQASALSVQNPFGESSLSADYVDMLGVGSANGFETTVAAAASRPQSPRRTTLDDTNVNSANFANADYRGIKTGTNGMQDDQLYKFWPRNSTSGAWNPITGLPKVDPVVAP